MTAMTITRQTARLATVLLAVVASAPPFARAAEKAPINITGYSIDANLSPADHTLTAVTSVTFTAQQPVAQAEFLLHGALKVDKVTDGRGTTVNGERGPDASVLITPNAPLSVGKSYTWTFNYSGAIESDAGGPVPGLKLAYVGDPITYLLYAGRWFPMTGYQIDRFTANIHVHVPAGDTVIGSGAASAPASGRRPGARRCRSTGRCRSRVP